MNITAQTTQLIQNHNVQLSVKIYSEFNTETIILLHGGPGVPDDMIEVVNSLKDKYRVVTFDQRGTGASQGEKCTYTMADYISDIDVIAEELQLENFHLFGHSWGGLYAQIYADAQPSKIKSLFLCSPSSGTNVTWKMTEKEVLEFNKKITPNVEWLGMGWHSFMGMIGSDKAYQKLFKRVLTNYNIGYSQMEIPESYLSRIYSAPINTTRKEIIRYKPLPVAANPTFPIMITYGDNDIYGNSIGELIKRFPTAELKILQPCGHIPWLHNSEVFTEALIGFYNS